MLTGSAFLQIPQSVSITVQSLYVLKIPTRHAHRIDMQVRPAARKHPPDSRTPALRRGPPSCPVAASSARVRAVLARTDRETIVNTVFTVLERVPIWGLT